GNYSSSDNWCCRCLWAASFNHPRFVVRNRRHDGGQWFRLAAFDSAQYCDGVDFDAASRDGDLGHALLGVLKHILSLIPSTRRWSLMCCSGSTVQSSRPTGLALGWQTSSVS